MDGQEKKKKKKKKKRKKRKKKTNGVGYRVAAQLKIRRRIVTKIKSRFTVFSFFVESCSRSDPNPRSIIILSD